MILNNQVTPSNLREIIKTYFNDSELRDLCMDLGIDYDSLGGNKKSDKARELVLFLDRHQRTNNLINSIRKLRPHIGLNVQKLAINVFESDDPQLHQLTDLLQQVRQYNERLAEWKELHNRMNNILLAYDIFSKQVERIDARGEKIELGMLQLSWKSTYQQITESLEWAGNINYIGIPFKITNNEITGMKWAIDMKNLGEFIQNHLWRNNKVLSSSNWWVTLHHLWRNSFDGRFGKVSSSSNWWVTLRENTHNLDSAIKQHLTDADKKLRETVGELYDLSAKALWS